MCPRKCCRFSVPTQTTQSSRLAPAFAPVMSPTLVNRSPHCAASRLMTFSPSACASSRAVSGEMKWTWVSAVIQPCRLRSAPRSSGDHQLGLARLDLELRAQRLVLEPLGSFDEHLADRQLGPERSVDVGVRRVAELHVGAVILEPVVVDLVAVAVRREVAAVRRPEVDPRGRRLPGRGVHDLAAQPGPARRQQLDPNLTVRAAGRAALQHVAERDVLPQHASAWRPWTRRHPGSATSPARPAPRRVPSRRRRARRRRRRRGPRTAWRSRRGRSRRSRRPMVGRPRQAA